MVELNAQPRSQGLFPGFQGKDPGNEVVKCLPTLCFHPCAVTENNGQESAWLVDHY